MEDNKIYMCGNQIEKIKSICAEFGNDAGELINILHRTQGELGYLPMEVQELIAMELKVPVSKIYGVVTFYSFFTMVPKGKYPVSVCLGTACYVRGSEQILDEFKKQLGIGIGETTEDGLFSLDCLRCVGACGLAPVTMVANKVYGRLTPDSVHSILAEYYNKE